jgi:hypothetical protein
MEDIGGASERDRTSGLLITNELLRGFMLLIRKIINRGAKSIVVRLCSPAAPPRLPFHQTGLKALARRDARANSMPAVGL